MADSGLPTPTTSFSHSHVEEDGPSDMARGLMMVGVVILFLFSLVAVRLMCNVFIDIAILGDAPSLMKILSEIRRMICPCWHPRTEPQQDNNNNNRRRDSGRIDRTATAGASRSVLPVETEIVNMHSLLAGLSPEEKQELLASILNSKVQELLCVAFCYNMLLVVISYTHFSHKPIIFSLDVATTGSN